MTLKHWALVGGAVACFGSPYLLAAPWLEPGDSRARFAAQKLADRGHMDRTVSTWPLMWSAVHSGLQPSVGSDQSSVGSAAAYLRFEQEQQAEQGFRGEYSLHGSSEIPAIRGFDQNSLAKAGTAIDLQWQGEVWALGAAHQTRWWYDRVRSASNPSYSASRVDWEELYKIFPDVIVEDFDLCGVFRLCYEDLRY